MENIIVTNLINAKGNPTANQFVIDYYENDNHCRAFQSYSSRVCEVKIHGDSNFRKVVKFGCDWDYSRTTMKHLNEFLRQNGCEALNSADVIRKAIKNGFKDDIKVIYDDTMC